jgi:hypothetical protein
MYISTQKMNIQKLTRCILLIAQLLLAVLFCKPAKCLYRTAGEALHQLISVFGQLILEIIREIIQIYKGVYEVQSFQAVLALPPSSFQEKGLTWQEFCLNELSVPQTEVKPMALLSANCIDKQELGTSDTVTPNEALDHSEATDLVEKPESENSDTVPSNEVLSLPEVADMVEQTDLEHSDTKKIEQELEKMTVKKLRNKAQSLGIPGVYKFKKKDLIEAIIAASI